MQRVRGCDNPDLEYRRPLAGWPQLRVGDLGGFPQALIGSAWRRTNLAIMAGDGALCPEGQPLKALRAVFQAVCHPPAAGPMLVTAVTSQDLEASTMKTSLGSAAESAGELYVRTDISPEQIFQAIGRLRKEARDEIDRLIRFLDATENHMELEPEDEGDDSELEDDDPAENDLDDEPSLGSCDPSMGGGDQTRWAAGDRRDLEDDPTESGIGDHDGLLEQVGWQDWQHTVMA